MVAQRVRAFVQCCFLARAEITTPALTRLARDTIACADTVGKIATQARAKQLVLTHFRQKSHTLMQEVVAEGRVTTLTRWF